MSEPLYDAEPLPLPLLEVWAGAAALVVVVGAGASSTTGLYMGVMSANEPETVRVSTGKNIRRSLLHRRRRLRSGRRGGGRAGVGILKELAGAGAGDRRGCGRRGGRLGAGHDQLGGAVVDNGGDGLVDGRGHHLDNHTAFVVVAVLLPAVQMAVTMAVGLGNDERGQETGGKDGGLHGG